jgi:hypothetical protein
MYYFQVYRSDAANKKYKVIIYKDGSKLKTINFGDNRYNDYIEYNRIDKNLANQRKRLYLIRHQNEDFNNFLTASYWSKNILWNKPTLELSIKVSNSIGNPQKKDISRIKIYYIISDYAHN